MQSITGDTKLCRRCGKTYPATTEFFILKKATGTLVAPCHTCRLAARRAYYVKNIEVEREKAKAYQKANLDTVREKNRRWQEKNLEYVIAKRKESYQKNIEEQRAKNRKKYRENPERYLVYGRTARAKRYGVKGTHTVADVMAQFEQQGGKCFYCGAEMELQGEQKFTVDHFIPISRGGGNSPENLVCSCAPCNSSKCDDLPWDWQPERFKTCEFCVFYVESSCAHAVLSTTAEAAFKPPYAHFSCNLFDAGVS